MQHHFFVTAGKGLTALLRDELVGLGLTESVEKPGGVSFDGSLQQAYRTCLWSRIGNRVLLQLDSFSCTTADALYQGIRQTNWAKHMQTKGSFFVRFLGTDQVIRNSPFGALRGKDAIVDQFRESSGERPSVSAEQPDLQVYVHLARSRVTLYLDLSGDSLHKRGYRSRGGHAPLKENLAAAILIKSKWPSIGAKGGGFIDPMCGSATLPIEAAMIAGDIAPGLQRRYFGFLGWKGHDIETWESLIAEATARKEAGMSKIPEIHGYDISQGIIKHAVENVRNAGLQDFIRIEKCGISTVAPHGSQNQFGLLAVNPPYGERMGADQGLEALYYEFGQVLKSRFEGWKVVMLVGNAELGFRIGIRSSRPATFYNGAIECRLLQFDVVADRFFVPKNRDAVGENRAIGNDSFIDRARHLATSGECVAESLINRLRKNLRNIGRWADRQGIACYRLYDADIPEYSLAIDLYRGESCWVHVQEYQAPRGIDPAKAERRLLEGLAVLPSVLEVEWKDLFLKVRRVQKGVQQYGRSEFQGEFHEVREANYRFYVNLEGYLDTGLFLDHRITRGYIGQHSRGCRFLNLFGYTGSATVYAAGGGATATTTVDLSRTYLDWTRRNLVLNGFGARGHELVQADVMAWLDQVSGETGEPRCYDLIFLDPPTFSNSKRMEGTFDVQRDHVDLIIKAVQLLAPGGMLIFSTNHRKFKLEQDFLRDFSVVDISRRTLPRDFERNPRIHSTWEICHVRSNPWEKEGRRET